MKVMRGLKSIELLYLQIKTGVPFEVFFKGNFYNFSILMRNQSKSQCLLQFTRHGNMQI